MSAPPRLRIGTRGSELARWQADHVAGLLRALPEGPEVEIVIIKTEGDVVVDVPLSQVGGKAFFTKEIEQALLDRQVDLAVHSLKDLATAQPAGLGLGAVLEREDPRDVLLAPEPIGIDDLPEGARVGTSSLRRRALLARWRPDLELADLRGNVPTRIRKMLDGAYDAIVLAAAGVKRLGLEEHIAAWLPPDRMTPAVSQGAVAVQMREGDEDTLRRVERLDHAPTRAATAAERALLGRLEGGCQVPVGALATVDEQELVLNAVVCSLDGSRAVEGSREGTAEGAEGVGLALAETLLEEGAKSILDEIRAGSGGDGS